MKTSVKNLFLLSVLIARLDLILPARVTAQTFTPLYSFTGGSDGEEPQGRLIISGNTLYGTAGFGGSSGVGTVFAVNTDGSGFTNLHTFTPLCGSAYTNSDGARPYAGLILSGNTLVWDGRFWRQFGQGHGVQGQHRWHGFYDSA